MKRLEIKGINFAEVTLHVGLGTFNPIEVEDLSKHKMESEEIIIDEKNAAIINKAVEAHRRVCAVGTTTMRALETSVSSNKKISAFNGWTNKFIYPPHEFGVANSMITNFHTPKSTLIMMIAAFAGRDFVMHAYEEAVKEKYKFYSYGDAMLIL
jgi:S-adenosylmethionine:tRNA ribosyltransferase-isomerase